jgi:hypothetical protein
LAIKTYSVIGICNFKPEEVIIEMNNHLLIINHSQIENITFYYGGYKGVMSEFDIFITGIGVRDGSKNIIEINETKYQILLESRPKLEFINKYFNDMKKKNINANFITKH